MRIWTYHANALPAAIDHYDDELIAHWKRLAEVMAKHGHRLSPVAKSIYFPLIAKIAKEQGLISIYRYAPLFKTKADISYLSFINSYNKSFKSGIAGRAFEDDLITPANRYTILIYACLVRHPEALLIFNMFLFNSSVTAACSSVAVATCVFIWEMLSTECWISQSIHRYTGFNWYQPSSFYFHPLSRWRALT